VNAFSFRLASVLRVRRVEAAVAHGQVAEAARLLARAAAREREIAESYRRGNESITETDGVAFIASFERGGRLAEMLAEATRARSGLETRLGEAQSMATVAEQRVKMLDRLQERRRAEWLDGLQREDTAELDEFSARRATRTAMAARHVD
jgi:hypothetical protein